MCTTSWSTTTRRQDSIQGNLCLNVPILDKTSLLQHKFEENLWLGSTVVHIYLFLHLKKNYF